MLRATVSGTTASLASTAVLVLRDQHERDDPIGPINGPSQWIWGKPSARCGGFSVRRTLTGYLIHQAESVFWATFYEKWRMEDHQRGSAIDPLKPAVAISTAACFVDYLIAPERLSPGFERQLSWRSLSIVYAALACGLTAGAMLEGRIFGRLPDPQVEAGDARKT
jgi:hypothetical protein